MATVRRFRVELEDVNEDAEEAEERYKTLHEVSIRLPTSVEVPGERFIEAARLAYAHALGEDLERLLRE